MMTNVQQETWHCGTLEEDRACLKLDKDVGVDVSIRITASFTGPTRHRGHIDVFDHNDRGAPHTMARLHH